MPKRTLCITLPYMPPQHFWPNRSMGRSWQVRYYGSKDDVTKENLQDDIRILVWEQGWKSVNEHMMKAHITLTFRYPNGGFDLDGALFAMKNAIDALKPWVIVDDNATRVSYSLAWERSKKKEVEILVEER